MSAPTSAPLDVMSPPSQIPVASLRANYLPISNLGNGSFGTVELAKYRSRDSSLLNVCLENRGTMLDPLCDCQPNPSKLVAVKTMKKRLAMLNDYTRVKEVKFIQSIPSHPCLMQIYEMFIDDTNYQLHISMEPMSQNLYQLMKARKSTYFSSVTLRSILSQLLCAIRHIHRYNFFHRDVKPENILVVPTQHYYGSKSGIPPYRQNDNFVVKLADYGLARHVHNLKPYTAYVSTRWYRSPEILLRQRWYSRPIDIWAFGAVASEVANFMPLFPGSNELDQIWRILKIMGSPLAPTNHSSPLTSNSATHVVPLGGYWNEAGNLARKLGFVLPPEAGVSITDIMTNSHHRELGDVVKACLTWDPQHRPTCEQIGNMPYFRGSPAGAPYVEPARYSDNSTRFQRMDTVTRPVPRCLVKSSPHRSPSSISRNVRDPTTSNFVAGNVHANAFDNDDDGYEREFMKENVPINPMVLDSAQATTAAALPAEPSVATVAKVVPILAEPHALTMKNARTSPNRGVYQRVTNLISTYNTRDLGSIDPQRFDKVAAAAETPECAYMNEANSMFPVSAEMDAHVGLETDGGGDGEYSWDMRQENQDLLAAVAPDLLNVSETPEEEYGLVSDVSFGSGQEINVS